jgi:hypothetical protein
MAGRGERLSGGWKAKLAGAGAGLLGVAGLATISGSSASRAYADASAPPPFPAKCPIGQAPPPGYPNPPPTTPWTYPATNDVTGQPNQSFTANSSAGEWQAPGPGGPHDIVPNHQYGPGFIQYLAPFKGIIANGTITFHSPLPGTPAVVIPHLFASVCGVAEVPQLTGSLPTSGIDLATPNVYVGAPSASGGIQALEAIPISAAFGSPTNPLKATILPQPAANGGINAALSGIATSTVNTLGLSCGVSLTTSLSTQSGQPVTGPPTDGYAEVEATHIPIPPLQPSAGCPAAIASTFNTLLGLGSGTGYASLVTPFCFDFELNGRFTAPRSALCPWP